MSFRSPSRWSLTRSGSMLAAALLVSAAALADEHHHDVLVLTTTNSTSGNQLIVFKLEGTETPSLTLDATLPTGGVGGASGNAGILKFKDDFGATANFGSNTVTRFVRHDDSITVSGTVKLASGCTQPDSVALTAEHLFVVGANCAESHLWPSGSVDGVAKITDASAGQIAVGTTWAAVTLKSGSVLQLPRTPWGGLSGAIAPITLPENANNTPLGADFWGDTLGFNPAHSPDSFALVNPNRDVFPIAGPTPSFPSNAPCWVVKGPGNIWYAGNSPGEAISIFFSDGQGGVFYKSIPLPGVATDITVSPDGKLLAVIYSASGSGYIAVFSIDGHGDLTPVATSSPIGVSSFNGVAISE